MSRATPFKLALPALAAVALLSMTGGTDASTAVGPPWLSIEFPVNPMDPTTRGAALLVHAFHHERPAAVPVSGTAEGLVNGERRTVDLEIRKTSRPGVYAIDQNWPAEGDWVLAIGTGAHSDMSLVVELGPDGGVRQQPFYDWTVQTATLRSVHAVAGGVGAERIERALRGASR